MRILALLLSMLALPAFGQTFGQTAAFRGAAVPNVPSTPAAFHPTNIAGVTCIAYYDADVSIGGGGATAFYLTNQMGGNDLTNNFDFATCPTRVTSNSEINNHTSLKFLASSNQELRSTLTTVQPFEHIFVLAITNQSVNMNILGNKGGDDCYVQFQGSGPFLRTVAGASMYIVGNSFAVTNKWFVMDLVYNSTSSQIITNNVLGKTGNAGTNSCANLDLGRALASNPFNGQFACLLIYTNLDAANRTNVYNWLSNRYTLPAP